MDFKEQNPLNSFDRATNDNIISHKNLLPSGEVI